MTSKQERKTSQLAGARLSRLAKSNIIGIAAGTLTGEILEANEAFLNLIGYSRDDLEAGGLSWDNITPAEHADADRRAVEELNGTGLAAPWEKEFLHKDGRRVAVIIGAAMLGEDKNKTACVIFVLDISDRKRLEQQLNAAKLGAEAASRGKSAFLARISHEMRTLLNSILGMTELALDTELTAEQKGYIESVKISAETLLSILLHMNL